MMQSLQVEEVQNTDKRILIVDDYHPMRQLISDALNQSGHYLISEAENGREALDKCTQHPFDLVISDVMMPGMGGMELLNNLMKTSPETSVIMITAHPAVELTVSAMKKGAVDFLKKPFNIDNLLSKVQICLNEKKLFSASRAKKEAAEIHIQEKTRELSVQGFIHDSFEKMEDDHEHVFNKIVDLAMNVVDGEECALLTYAEEDGDFHPEIIRSNNQEAYERRTIPALKSLLQEVVRKKDAMMIHSAEIPEITPSLICAPLMIRNQIFGILCIRKKSNRGLFSTEDLHYISSLTKKAALNLENSILYESVYNNVLATFKSLIASIQVRDHYTEEHCTRVTKLAVRIAEGMHCSEREIESLKISGLLHDVGKIAIPDSVLLKPDRLTYEEFTIIKTHPDIAEQILKPILLFDQERDIIQHHHERWDGKGYPDGLAGKDIPLISRILSVADSFDAMTNNRPYRQAMEVNAAVMEMEKNRDTQFDGEIVDIFLKIL
jgi:response regulator RpfG family c-di-GMP phosphodiesterase